MVESKVLYINEELKLVGDVGEHWIIPVTFLFSWLLIWILFLYRLNSYDVLTKDVDLNSAPLFKFGEVYFYLSYCRTIKQERQRCTGKFNESGECHLKDNVLHETQDKFNVYV